MPDGDIAAYMRLRRMRRTVVKRMHHRTVLNIRPVTDTDAVHIAAQHRTVPNAAIAPDGHIAYQYRRFGQKRPFSHYGHMPAHFLDNRHISVAL